MRALIRSAALPETMPAIIDASGALQDITGGNPYFLRELLRELDDEPAKLDGDGELAADAGDDRAGGRARAGRPSPRPR